MIVQMFQVNAVVQSCSSSEEGQISAQSKRGGQINQSVTTFMGHTHPAIKYIYISWPAVHTLFYSTL